MEFIVTIRNSPEPFFCYISNGKSEFKCQIYNTDLLLCTIHEKVLLKLIHMLADLFVDLGGSVKVEGQNIDSMYTAILENRILIGITEKLMFKTFHATQNSA